MHIVAFSMLRQHLCVTVYLRYICILSVCGCFVNIVWKIRDNFTVGGFREGWSGYTITITYIYIFFALFRILEECYFINMRISLHRWEWMGAGFLFTRKMFEVSYFFCLKIVSFSKIRTSGNSLYQNSPYGNDYMYHVFAFINIRKVQRFSRFSTHPEGPCECSPRFSTPSAGPCECQ